jgi:hypothetical protein
LFSGAGNPLTETGFSPLYRFAFLLPFSLTAGAEFFSPASGILPYLGVE